jgi:uncharacterized membrane protein
MLKLGAFAFLGAAIAVAAFYFGWFFLVMTPVTPSTAGLDVGSSNIARLQAGVVALAIFATFMAFFRQLWNGAKHQK